MNEAKHLLERAAYLLGFATWVPEYGKLRKEIEDFLSTPQPTPDDEPVAWMLISTVGSRHYHMSEQQALKGLQMYGGKVIALYDHPAPRPEFVRLREEEVTEVLTSAYDMYAAICAVENRLVEKNK